jgi:hypothetical protein
LGEIGVSDVAAIRYLLELERLEKRVPAEALDVGWLKRYERPEPTLQEYDRLLLGSAPEVIQSLGSDQTVHIGTPSRRIMNLCPIAEQ